MKKRKARISAARARKISAPEFPNINDPLNPSPLTSNYEEFLISRRALHVSPRTLRWYDTTLKRFILWLQNSQGVTSSQEIRKTHVNGFLALLDQPDISKSYIHTYARTIRTFLNYLFEEDLIQKPVKVSMPTVKEDELKLKVLTADQVQEVMEKLESPRDLAMIAFFVDTGVRKNELRTMTWGDLNVNTGIAVVRNGKGGTQRVVAIGPSATKYLLRYRRTLKDSGPRAPLFQTDEGKQFTIDGLTSALYRMKEKTGVDLSSHALRRTFCTLAIRAKMNLFNIQAQMGHTDLKMTHRYARLITEDLIEDHSEHSPFDTFGK